MHIPFAILKVSALIRFPALYPLSVLLLLHALHLPSTLVLLPAMHLPLVLIRFPALQLWVRGGWLLCVIVIYSGEIGCTVLLVGLVVLRLGPSHQYCTVVLRWDWLRFIRTLFYDLK